MRALRGWFFLSLLAGMMMASAYGQAAGGVPQPAAAEQLFALANQARAEAGVAPLVWDPALAVAAMRHCQRMAVEGPIAHRYAGELDLTERAGAAGAHFSLIEENIAVGSHASTIHTGWMESPGHRTNLLNAQVDHVGIAVIAAQGVLFAVQDFSKSVDVLTQDQVEARIAALVKVSGVSVRRDNVDARGACRLDRGLPPLRFDQPDFIMRWRGADLDRLPADLVARLASGQYHQAEVGSCPGQAAEGPFTVYRVAVLLYDSRPQSGW
jgi:hypothetical protein